MAEGDGYVFNDFKERVLLGEFDLVDDTINVALIDSGWSATVDGAAMTYATVSGNELSGTGYTAKGDTITTPSVTQDDTNNRAAFDGDNASWTGLDAGTPATAVMFDDTHASDALIAYWEVTTASNGSDYTLQWHANGIMLLT